MENGEEGGEEDEGGGFPSFSQPDFLGYLPTVPLFFSYMIFHFLPH